MPALQGEDVVTVKQVEYRVPELTIKELHDAIPPHCFKRSAIYSGAYIVYDFLVIGALWKGTKYLETFITPQHIPHPYLSFAASFSLWALYSFFTGLFATGLWVIAHECGHQAFSASKTLNNAVGWVLHSSLGVPYHSWRITHAKHHASTGHMLQDQVYVPKTRSEAGLPSLDPAREQLDGSSARAEIITEMKEALGDSPIVAAACSMGLLLVALPLHFINNFGGQRRYPKGTSHLHPQSVMFAPHQWGAIIWSDVGIALWLAGIAYATYTWGFMTVFRTYLVPYLWVNHWIILITCLQHTDPLVPHYRAPEFTFPRGALSTLNRSLLGDLGPSMGWLGAHSTHGISETHVLHHVFSKIPHYNAWEASDALKKVTDRAGLQLEGAPGGWREMARIFKECRFVEDEGTVVFYKDARGLAKARPVFPDSADSGVELDK